MIKASPFVYITTILCLLCFLFSPFRLLQFLSLSILFIFLISYLYSKVLVRSIHVERNVDKLKLACKEKSEISLTIKNYSLLTAHVLYFFDEVPYFYIFNDANKGVTALRPHEIKRITYYVTSQDRGLFQCGPVRIRTSDPLGLFLVDVQVACPLEITVRPARIKLITNAIPGFPQGNLKINNPIFEDITMRRSIREYKNGDEQKRINWRASAKFDSLFTNQFENSFDSPFFIFLNLAEEDYDLHSRTYSLEKAIEIAACIVEKARVLRQCCGFAAYADENPYLAPKQNQTDCILDILSTIHSVKAKLDYDPAKKFLPQLSAGTLFFVIGPQEVESYFLKVEANRENINTQNTGIIRKNGRKI